MYEKEKCNNKRASNTLGKYMGVPQQLRKYNNKEMSFPELPENPAFSF